MDIEISRYKENQYRKLLFFIIMKKISPTNIYLLYFFKYYVLAIRNVKYKVKKQVAAFKTNYLFPPQPNLFEKEYIQ